MKAFITKYALTKGILELEGEIRNSTFGGADYFYVPANLKSSAMLFFRKDYHLTREEAAKDAERRRDAKIVALRKQIKKLEQMTF